MLAVDGVTLEYRTREHLVTATYRVSFEVLRSDRFVLLGPSGCGKSTLLKAVGGYVSPVEGRVVLNGAEVRAPGPDRVFVFQEFDQLLPWKTVEQNIVFALMASGKLAAREARERARHFIAKVNLTEFAASYPHTLSGGMKQRAAIARALAMEPQVLLMDEPFAALDALTRARMQEELLQLWEETRATILFVTHSIPEAIRVGSRILLLSPHPGQVRAELNGSTADAQRIEHLLFGDAHVSPPAQRTTQPWRAEVEDPGERPAPRQALCAERPEILREAVVVADVVPRRRGAWEKFSANGAARKAVMLVLLALVWEAYARWLANPLLFPSFSSTLAALWAGLASGELPEAAWYTIRLLLKGYAVGLAIAALLTALATATVWGADLLETLTAMFNPLPSIALLPLALIWFGLGEGSVIFVLIHAVLWAVALNTFAGFRGVSPTWRMVGQNYGLSKAGYIARILIPGAFPSILTGLKVGWAFAWRTLIAAELVFGVSSGAGGLGWYIFERKNQLLIPDVFAGLLTVILFGLAVENLVFRAIENRTVRRWGMQT